MDNIKTWCSNKENIKILFMIVMAIVLVIVLKNRFSGKEADNPDSSAARYENKADPQTEVATSSFDNKIPRKTAAPSKVIKFTSPEPPPFLKRDLFSSINSGHSSIGHVAKVEEVNLELKATIIDGQGALAIIGNDVVETGGVVNGLRVKAIKNNEVILSKGNKQFVLRIKAE